MVVALGRERPQPGLAPGPERRGFRHRRSASPSPATSRPRPACAAVSAWRIGEW